MIDMTTLKKDVKQLSECRALTKMKIAGENKMYNYCAKMGAVFKAPQKSKKKRRQEPIL